MARKPDSSGATEMLEEIEEAGDHLADWVAANPRLVIGIVLGVLAAAALYGGASAWSSRRADAASAALAETRAEYLAAMGASAGAFEVPELANPEAAEGVREEFRERFAEIGNEYGGTAAGTLARLAAGDLAAETGDSGRALTIWGEALDATASGSALRGVLLQRIAREQERAGRWPEAAETHERAAAVKGFPIAAFALSDAARCYDEAGQPDRALEVLERLEREYPDFPLADYLRARMRELQALQAATAAG